MKNRSNAFFVGFISLICLVILFFVFRLSSHSPVKKDVVSMLQTNKASLTKAATTDDIGGDATDNVTEIIDSLPGISKTDKHEIERMFSIRKSAEYQEFIDTYFQEIKRTYERTGVFDVDLQDFFDFFTTQGIPEINFDASMLKIFRDYFPTGTPEDYETEMKVRFMEVFSETPGPRNEALLEAFEKVAAEPDFSAWLAGRFKGNIGSQIAWLEEQAAIATAIEHAENPIDDTPPIRTEIAIDEIVELPTPAVETTHPAENKNLPQKNLETPAPQADARAQLTPERLSDIQETLNLYGIYNGLRHLLKNDPAAGIWLLENFDVEDISTWASEPMTETQPRTPPKNITSKQQEVPSWLEIPE